MSGECLPLSITNIFQQPRYQAYSNIQDRHFHFYLNTLPRSFRPKPPMHGWKPFYNSSISKIWGYIGVCMHVKAKKKKYEGYLKTTSILEDRIKNCIISASKAIAKTRELQGQKRLIMFYSTFLFHGVNL